MPLPQDDRARRAPPTFRDKLRALDEQNWTVIIASVILLFVGVSFLMVEPVGPKLDPFAPPAARPKGAAVSPESVPLVTGDEPLREIFTRAGCPVCHAIPGIRGAKGKVGPPLTLAATGASRLADPAYRGAATTVREYIIESILNPGIYVVPGYPSRAMPRWYGKKLTAQALNKIADHLSQAGQPPG